MSRNVLSFCIAITLLAGTASAATFVVPTDRDLIHRTDAIVIGSALVSYTQPTPRGGIETVTSVSIEEVVKGKVTGDTINVVEPGGVFGERAQIISGVPRFIDGQRVVLFLKQTGRDRWSATELVLGKFTFATEGPETLLLRDESEIVGWDPDLKQHREPRRAAAQFLQFIRAEAHGRTPNATYFSEAPAATPPQTGTAPKFGAAPNYVATALAFTANSYTMTMSGTSGGRWNVFPSGVSWTSSVGGEPGAPGAGATAINTAFASWNGDALSNVNYVYAGVDNGTHTQGLHASDGANTILFERDLSSWGVSPFTCSGSSYGGTLGIGGVSSASGTHTLNSETFFTTKETDVEMNKGIANCSALFNNGDWNSAITHEVGHTLGFRHSDQNRGSNGTCSGDPTLECSSAAIMTAVITHGVNGALQAWDQNAVRAVYPGASNPPPPPCTAPAITQQPANVTVYTGVSTTVSVSATNATSYQWYVGASGNTSSPVAGATGSVYAFSPKTTTSYWVRVSNSCGSVDSATATVTVLQIPAGSGVKGDFNRDGMPDMLWRNASAGATHIWLMNRTSYSSSVALPALPANWHPEVTADFNGDGNTDILWRNYNNGANHIWLMNGTSYVASIVLPSLATNWHAEASGDFNGDGYQDIVWRNYTTGETTIWIMGGTKYISSVAYAGPPLNWKLQGAADFNRDGNIDLLWRDSVTGSNHVHLLNRTAYSSSVVLEQVPDANWRVGALADYNG
ncbi:MAG: FG-GAP-like repeat-containing protein, partial [Thermoanaerobaculia bacterium]